LSVVIGSIKDKITKNDNDSRLNCLQQLATRCKFSTKDNISKYM